METRKTSWAICDGPSRDGSYCLFEQASLRRMTDCGGYFRCIRHGNILEPLSTKYDGMTRKEVRAAIDKAAEQAAHDWK